MWFAFLWTILYISTFFVYGIVGGRQRASDSLATWR